MISKKEVQRIARLARLKLTEKELEQYQKDFSSILDYVGNLSQIDAEISALVPTKHPFLLENAMREDEGRKNKNQNLIARTEKGYLKVKSILK